MPIKRDISITFVTRYGHDFSGTFPVYDGTSAYEDWLTLPGNDKKPLKDFFNSLHGETGTGIESVAGSRDSKTGKVTLTFKLTDKTLLKSEFVVKDGLNDYETFKSIAGNEQKTETDFFNSLKGADGDGIQSVTLIQND